MRLKYAAPSNVWVEKLLLQAVMACGTISCVSSEQGTIYSEEKRESAHVIAHRLRALSFRKIDVKIYSRVSGIEINNAPSALISSGISGKEIAEMRSLLRQCGNLNEDRGTAAEAVIGLNLNSPRQLGLEL